MAAGKRESKGGSGLDHEISDGSAGCVINSVCKTEPESPNSHYLHGAESLSSTADPAHTAAEC